MANGSRWFEREPNRWLDRLFAVLKPVGNHAQRERCGTRHRFVLSGTVGHHAGKVNYVGDKAAVIFAVDLEMEPVDRTTVGFAMEQAKELHWEPATQAECLNVPGGHLIHRSAILSV